MGHAMHASCTRAASQPSRARAVRPKWTREILRSTCGSYELLFDRGDFKEGEQSLHFRVHECSAEGGWGSPGITQEYPVPPGDYVVGFWIKNDGCDYVASAGGVAASVGVAGEEPAATAA